MTGVADAVGRRFHLDRVLSDRFVVILSLAIAALVRLLFILKAHLPFESDEAIVGLMARHILYAGERPIFYYGQSYLGPLEPASAALSFAILGPSVTALRLAPAMYSLIFVIFTVWFAKRAFGRHAAYACLAYLVAPPLFLLTWSVKARGGYAELIALGSVIVWLGLDISEAKDVAIWKWLALGVVSGLAVWTDPLAVVYVLPTAAYLSLRLGTRLFSWKTLGAIAACALISSPMLIANLNSHGEMLRELMGANVTEPVTLAIFRHNLVAVMRESVPTLLGFYQGSSNLSAFTEARNQVWWPEWAVTVLMAVLAAVAVFLGLASVWRACRRRPLPRDLLVWVAACTTVLFCISQVEVLYLTEPRYLLPLYALAPIAGNVWGRLWSARREVAVGTLLAVLTLNIVSVARFVPSLAAPYLDGKVVDVGNPSLATFLEERKIHAFYADYWLSYPVAFQSQERVIPSVIDDRLDVGFNRYIPYAVSVAQSAAPAVLVVRGSPSETRLIAFLRASGRSFQVAHWRNLDVFDQIGPAFRPGRA